jgi:DUF2911 family protein
MILRKMIPAIVLLCLATGVLAQDRGKAEAAISGKKISIDYGRPSLKGRDLLTWAQPGQVWRLGMNQPTVLETAATLVVAGKELKPGKYSLWAKKVDNANWILAFHPTVPGWGDPTLNEGYAAELPLKVTKAPGSAEQLTIALTGGRGKSIVKIHWGTALLSGSFDVK